MTKQTCEGHEIPTYSVKDSPKFKARFKITNISRMVKNVRNIVLF